MVIVKLLYYSCISAFLKIKYWHPPVKKPHFKWNVNCPSGLHIKEYWGHDLRVPQLWIEATQMTESLYCNGPNSMTQTLWCIRLLILRMARTTLHKIYMYNMTMNAMTALMVILPMSFVVDISARSPEFKQHLLGGCIISNRKSISSLPLIQLEWTNVPLSLQVLMLCFPACRSSERQEPNVNSVLVRCLYSVSREQEEWLIKTTHI